MWQSLFSLNLKDVVKLGSSCSEVFLQVFSLFAKILSFVAKFVRSESLDAVKSAASCGEVFLQVFSFFMKVLPFVARFVQFES